MKYSPSQKQLKFLNWEMGAFFHFGIRSFNPGHSDWDNREMLLETFNPDSLNCEQWIREIKSAGMNYAILTAKHHDGFANWPTKYSEYSVASTHWKNGKGDVVREFCNACRKYGIAVGLYYSPAQWGKYTVPFEKSSEYDDYFINQISELLTDYGKIDYLWFDACGSDNHKYDINRICKVINELQPDIMIFSMWNPDTMWVGNEDGMAGINNSNVATCDAMGKTVTGFFPYECDCRIRETWFYDNNEDTIKTTDELIGMYEMSVGHGANLLLNIGPDNHGRLCDADVCALKNFKAEIDRRYSYPLEFKKVYQNINKDYVIEYSEKFQQKLAKRNKVPIVNSIIIKEDIKGGNAVKGFRIYAAIPSINPISETEICIYKGDTIGHKTICRFSSIRTARLTLKITDSENDVKIISMEAFNGSF